MLPEGSRRRARFLWGARVTDGSRSGAAQWQRATASYGSWASPITARLIAESGIALGGLQAAGSQLFWVEMRPLEDGRSTLVRRTTNGAIGDVVPATANTRTLVQEYGGGIYALHTAADGEVIAYFSEFEDQRLYRLVAGGATSGAAASDPRPITPAPPQPRSVRYADGRVTPDGQTLVCVRERHEDGAVVNELVALPTDGSAAPRVVATGHDFYAAPRLSHDGRRLAWLSWDHPQMPWDGTGLWVADLTAAGELAAERRVAGGPAESVLQPAWGADGRLHFVSDRDGWWNLYRDEGDQMTALAPLAAEFAKPPWVFGLQNYDFLHDGRIAATFGQDGVEHLGVIDPARPGIATLPCELTTFSSLVVLGDQIAVIGGGAARAAAVALVDPQSGAVREVRRSKTIDVDPGYISAPEPITFLTSYPAGSVVGPLADELEGAAGSGGAVGLTAHALYYAPANRDLEAPPGERPPLIVMSHGGPTSAAYALLSFDIQYWTSRGIGVVDVNYGGSTGYGRAYRERLRGNWGIVDTIDCINAARYLADRGDADPERIAVQGGSAGGYTTLNALARHRFFAAGASYFGLADLEVFATGGTHKFESQYLTGLLGPHPQMAAVYRERSPINHVADISCPVIVLQGLDDAIVPPAQAEIIVAALEKKGLPYAYLAFPGEQHGFRKAANIVRSHEAELYFYGRVFGFAPADEIEAVDIRNLD
jgi:dipeptidyl aminopeptidase/acylaminoacyl peptidase